MKTRIAILFLLLCATSVSAQTFSITPDSGTAGSSLQVSIAGSGTQFKPTAGVSGFYTTEISLKQSGQTLYRSYPSSISSNTAMSTSWTLPSSLASGWYDVSIVRVDTPAISYSKTNAFYVNAAPAKITSVTKNYGYAGHTTGVVITGFNTNFTGFAGQIAINFKQSGTTVFQAVGDSIMSATKLHATVTIPSTASGTFDISVTNPGFNYTGAKVFSVYADPGNQAFNITPDSGAAGSSLQVSIVGNGTHFAATGTVSGFQGTMITLSQAGKTAFVAFPSAIVSDSLMRSTFNIPSSLQTGAYDATITQTIAPYYTVTQSNAFYVTGATPKLISITPSSGYLGDTVHFVLQGQNTAFDSSTVAINFRQPGIGMFWTTSDATLSATKVTGTVIIPATAAVGQYDIIVDASKFTYEGSNLFTVLTARPSISISPNTGPSGDTIAVTITGQNTNFVASQGISVINTITLSQSGQLFLQTSPTKVNSMTSMDATFVLTNIPAGTYDVELKSVPYYDYLTTFTVTPHTFIMPARPKRDTVRTGESVSVAIIGHGTHFSTVLNTQTTAILRNPQFPTTTGTIIASNVTVTNDTALSASFDTKDYPVGAYDLIVTEPSGAQETLQMAVIVQAASGVDPKNGVGPEISNLIVSPNPSAGHIAISFALAKSAVIRLRIFDALGQTVANLCNQVVSAGPQKFEWTSDVANGTYFYELATEAETRTGQIVMSR